MTAKDSVAMPSLKADGTPDQTPDYEVLDEPAAKTQAEAQKAADQANAPDAEQATSTPKGTKR